MKYYIDENNNITRDYTKGYEEYLLPIHPDGVTILPKHDALEYDEEGNITNPDVVAILEAQALEQANIEAKQAQNEALATMVITTSNGNEFDAYTQARLDMNDAILASTTLGITETVWRMTDNTDVLISIDELKEAQALAIQKYAQIKAIGV